MTGSQMSSTASQSTRVRFIQVPTDCGQAQRESRTGIGLQRAGQTGKALEFNPNSPRLHEEIDLRIATICERHRAIYAQIGLMKVMELNEVNFTAIRENPQATREYLGAHLDKLVDVQNGDVADLVSAMRRAMVSWNGHGLSVDLQKLFGFTRSE